jgi:hypothetical protein
MVGVRQVQAGGSRATAGGHMINGSKVTIRLAAIQIRSLPRPGKGEPRARRADQPGRGWMNYYGRFSSPPWGAEHDRAADPLILEMR